MLEGVGGAVGIRNESGRVEVGGLTGAALTAVHRLETSYGDPIFGWPGAGSHSLLHTGLELREDPDGLPSQCGRKGFPQERAGASRIRSAIRLGKSLGTKRQR